MSELFLLFGPTGSRTYNGCSTLRKASQINTNGTGMIEDNRIDAIIYLRKNNCPPKISHPGKLLFMWESKIPLQHI